MVYYICNMPKQFPVALIKAIRDHPRSVFFNLTREDDTIKIIWHTRKRGKYYKRHIFYLEDNLCLGRYTKILRKLNKNICAQNVIELK